MAEWPDPALFSFIKWTPYPDTKALHYCIIQYFSRYIITTYATN